jgi:hypothetical protein
VRFHRPRPFLRFARASAFLAAFAFLLQGLAMSAAQAAAVSGMMADGAVELIGSLHFHGQLVGHVHSHDGDNGEGHVHLPTTGHDDHADTASSWALFCPSLDIPANAALQYSARLSAVMEVPKAELANGLAPPGLIRPPSTPGIA